MSQVARKQRQAGHISEGNECEPDPQDPARPSRGTPLPQAQTRRSVPDREDGDGESNDNMDDPRNVEAFRLVTEGSQRHLHKHDDKDGKADLGVRAVEVRSRTDLDDNEDEADQHEQEGDDLNVAMHGEPREQGATESTDENGSWHKDVPSHYHRDHVGDDEVVAPVQDAVRLVLVTSARGGIHSSAATSIAARRRRGRRGVIRLGEIQGHGAISCVALDLGCGARGRVVIFVGCPNEGCGFGRCRFGARHGDKGDGGNVVCVNKGIYGNAKLDFDNASLFDNKLGESDLRLLSIYPSRHRIAFGSSETSYPNARSEQAIRIS